MKCSISLNWHIVTYQGQQCLFSKPSIQHVVIWWRNYLLTDFYWQWFVWKIYWFHNIRKEIMLRRWSFLFGLNIYLTIIQGLRMGSSISILTKKSYYHALSREMTQATWVKHVTCVRYLRPIDELIMYTDYLSR